MSERNKKVCKAISDALREVRGVATIAKLTRAEYMTCLIVEMVDTMTQEGVPTADVLEHVISGIRLAVEFYGEAEANLTAADAAIARAIASVKS